MDPVILPLLSALFGALIGSGTSVMVIYLQGKQEDRKHVRELVTKLALDDHERAFKVVQNQGGELPPIMAFVAYYLKMSDCIRQGTLGENDIAEATEYMKNIMRAIPDGAQL